MNAIEIISAPERARILMDPLRRGILELARKPVSASQAAVTLGHPRQNMNYHFKTLRESQFLEPAGELRKGNMLEKRYRASARHYLLLPSVLGRLVSDLKDQTDQFSAAQLLGLSVEMQDQLAQVLEAAAERKQRVSTLSFQSPVRFRNAEQRSRFTRALTEAVTRVVREYASPAETESGDPAEGRLYRLVLGCYPLLDQQS